MNTTQQVEVAVLTFIKATYEADKPAVLDAIQVTEGGVEGFLINAIDNAPKPAGLVGTLFGMLRPQLDSYVKRLWEKEGPTVVFTFIDNELANGLAAVSK